MNIGFIGAGNMGAAIAKGIVANQPALSKQIYIADKDYEKAETMATQYDLTVLANNRELVEKSDIIFIAVKPNVYGHVLNEINMIVNKKQVIVSIAAGISIEFIQGFFKEEMKLIRTMPNTPALVGEGMTAVSANAAITKDELENILELLKAIGKVEVIDEKLMDMVPAVSGSSPAYVYMFIEALADGAVLQGMPRDQAYRFASQAVLGSAKMVLESSKHPGELKDMVCSPGGTTIEAVYELEKSGFRGAIIQAMNACTEKSKKLISK